MAQRRELWTVYRDAMRSINAMRARMREQHKRASCNGPMADSPADDAEAGHQTQGTRAIVRKERELIDSWDDGKPQADCEQ